jgi:hypothetical protein
LYVIPAFAGMTTIYECITTVSSLKFPEFA